MCDIVYFHSIYLFDITIIYNRYTDLHEFFVMIHFFLKRFKAPKSVVLINPDGPFDAFYILYFV